LPPVFLIVSVGLSIQQYMVHRGLSVVSNYGLTVESEVSSCHPHTIKDTYNGPIVSKDPWLSNNNSVFDWAISGLILSLQNLHVTDEM
jgi:hypothetical protein